MLAIGTIRTKAAMFQIQEIRVQNRSLNIEGSLKFESQKKQIVFDQELYFDMFNANSLPETMLHISHIFLSFKYVFVS